MCRPHRNRPRLGGGLRGIARLGPIGAALVVCWACAGCSGEERREREVAEAIAAGRLDEAERLVEGWLSRNPEDPEGLAWAARVALAQDRFEEAAEYSRRAQQRGLDRGELRDIEGIVLSRSGRPLEAAPLLMAHLAASDLPEPMAARALAEAGLATFNIPLARQALDRWKRDAPGDASPWIVEARVADRASDDPFPIVAAYREALRRDQERDEARLGLADALHRASRYEEAAEQFRAYLDRHPDDPEALAGAGLNAIALGDFDAAEPLLTEALRRDPEHLDALKGMARLTQQGGRFEEALGYLERAAAVEPSDGDIPYQQSLVLSRLGRREETERMRERADRLRAEADEIRELRNALVRAPGDPDLQYEVARWLIAHGHAEEGIRWAETLLQARPGHRPTCLLLAEHYEEAGRLDLASYYRWQAGPEGRSGPRP